MCRTYSGPDDNRDLAPGITTLTRTPRSRRSPAAASASAFTPPFAAGYPLPPKVPSDAAEPVSTIDPDCCSANTRPAIEVTWNTTATNFVASAAISQLATPALVAYINNLTVGLPINLFELQETFQLSVAAILAPQLLTRMVFTVSINGIGTAPNTGTGIIVGDPESYFLTTTSAITIVQG